MITVQFQTKIKDGVIQIPKKYRGKVNNTARVILTVAGEKKATENYLDQLLRQPVKVKNFQRLTREQIYVR